MPSVPQCALPSLPLLTGDVPYALDVQRWEDPAPLSPNYRYEDKAFTKDGMYCAQPGRAYTAQSKDHNSSHAATLLLPFSHTVTFPLLFSPHAESLPLPLPLAPLTRSHTVPVRQRLGLGTPTENPFFADIYAPSDVAFEAVDASLAPPSSSTITSNDQPHTPAEPLRPVRVFIHGGFLQFGSTSGSHYNQQFFAAEHFGEVRVLLGHR